MHICTLCGARRALAEGGLCAGCRARNPRPVPDASASAVNPIAEAQRLAHEARRYMAEQRKLGIHVGAAEAVAAVTGRRA